MLAPPRRRGWPSLVARQRRSSSLALRALHVDLLLVDGEVGHDRGRASPASVSSEWGQNSLNTNPFRRGGAIAGSQVGPQFGSSLQPTPARYAVNSSRRRHMAPPYRCQMTSGTPVSSHRTVTRPTTAIVGAVAYKVSGRPSGAKTRMRRNTTTVAPSRTASANRG